MYIRKIERNLILLVCLITSSIMIFFIQEACNTKVQASSLFMGNGQTKFIIISTDYLELEDIAQNEYLKYLFNRSCSALISGRQSGRASASKAKLAIGTGKRLQLNNTIVRALSPKSGENQRNIIYQDIEELRSINKNSEYFNSIGYLGDKLNALDKSVCLLGNSDTEIYDRDNILIGMDSRGAVDYGEVETTIIYDKSFPGGKRTDYKRLAELYRAYLPNADLLIIDTGDLARLEYYRNKLNAYEYQELRKQAVTRISELVKTITATDNVNICYLVISAFPSSNSLKLGNKLTPVFVYEADKEGGLLFSKSTRREGIISNLDIAAYIIEKLTTGEGSQLQERKTAEPLKHMLNLNRRILNVSVLRLPILTWYAMLEILCGVFGLLYLLSIKFIRSNRLHAFIKSALLINITAPAVLLYMAVLDIENALVFFIIFILADYAVVYGINSIFRNSMGRFAAAAFVVNASLAVDLMRNSFLIKSSVFGYDPIIGARFYGVGNEFAGVYIGSAIMLAGCVLQLLRNKLHKKSMTANALILLYFIFQVYIIGMPTKGANFGATIAAVCGCFFFICSVLGKRINIRLMLSLMLIIALVISTVITVDIMNNSNTTHIGRFFTDIKENGTKILLSTIGRKLEMNLRLIKYTIWTKVLLCIILIITIMFFKPVKLLHNIFRQYQYLASAWLGISAASIAGLIVNDSGIVMAATAMIFTGYTILYMCLEELQTDNLGG